LEDRSADHAVVKYFGLHSHKFPGEREPKAELLLRTIVSSIVTTSIRLKILWKKPFKKRK